MVMLLLMWMLRLIYVVDFNYGANDDANVTAEYGVGVNIDHDVDVGVDVGVDFVFGVVEVVGGVGACDHDEVCDYVDDYFRLDVNVGAVVVDEDNAVDVGVLCGCRRFLVLPHAIAMMLMMGYVDLDDVDVDVVGGVAVDVYVDV